MHGSYLQALLRRSVAVLATTTVMLAGCEGSDAAASGDVATANADATAASDGAVSGTFGTAGGTLEGEVGTELEGVRLVIPAGALAADTVISLRRVVDSSPLPSADASRCGPTIAVEPEGLELAAAASLTLPTEADALSAASQTHEQVRVWLREGEGFKQVGPTATSEQSVTFDMPQLTRAAPGLVLVVLPPICELIDCVPPLSGAACTEPDGFCVDAIATGNSGTSFTPFTTSGGFIYFAVEGTLSITASRMAITTGTTSSKVLQTPRQVSPSGRGAVDSSGALLVGALGQGIARFPFVDGASELQSIGCAGRNALRGTQTGSKVFRVCDLGYRVDGGGLDAWPTGTNGTSAALSAISDGGNGLWFIKSPGIVSHLAVGAEFFTKDLNVSAAGGVSMNSATRLALSPNGAWVVERTTGGVNDQVVVLATDGSTSKVLGAADGLPSKISDLAIDNAGGLWLASATASQLFYRTPAGAMTGTLIASGTTVSGFIPRFLSLQADGSVIARLAAGGFYRIRRI